MGYFAGGIDRESSEPLHAQLKRLVHQAIKKGELRPGDRLPTEQELCRMFGLSRTPVRQALTELVQEGLLVRIPGRGTFVAEQPKLSTSPLTLRAVVEPGWSPPLQQAARLWNRDHPHKTVHLVVEEVPYPQLRGYLIEQVAVGTAPDISLLDSAWVAEFADLGYLWPLDDVVPHWEARHAHRLVEASLHANRYKNRLMAVPANVDVTVLWYRKDWLEEEGLKAPYTWEDLLQVGHHFRHPQVSARFGFDTHAFLFVGGQRGGETTTYQLLPLLWSAGGDIIAGGRVVLDQQATRVFLAFLRSLVWVHALTPPDVVRFKWDQASRLFAQHKAVMALGGLYEMPFICRTAGWTEREFLAHVGVAPVPAGPTGQFATLGGMSYGIYRQSPHPDLALSVLEYTGHPQVIRLFWKHHRYHTPWTHVTPPTRLVPYVAHTQRLLQYGRPRPSIPEYTRISEQFRWLVEESLHQEAELDMLITRAADRIAAIARLPLWREV